MFLYIDRFMGHIRSYTLTIENIKNIQAEQSIEGGCLDMLLLAALTIFYLPLYVIFGLTKRYM